MTETRKGGRTPMFSTARRPARPVLPLIPLILLALTAAACGGSGAATQAASATAAGAAESSAPSAVAQSGAASPASSEVPSAAASAQADLLTGDAATRLANLTSYQFHVKVQGGGFAGGQGQTGAFTMDGTVVLKPAKAIKVTMGGLSGGSSGGALTYTIVGDTMWMNVGGQEMQIPAGQAGDAQKQIDDFLPTTLFTKTYGDYLSGFQRVGDESKNGVDTVHYRADATTLSAAAQAAGAQAGTDWKMDVWLAKDGGYLVSGVSGGTVTVGSEQGTYMVSVDITNINDPANVVQHP